MAYYLSELEVEACRDFQLNQAKTQGSKGSKITASNTFESRTLKCKSRCKTSLPLEGLPSTKRLSTRTQTTLAFHVSVVMQHRSRYVLSFLVYMESFRKLKPWHIETVAAVAFQETRPPSVVLHTFVHNVKTILPQTAEMLLKVPVGRFFLCNDCSQRA